MNVGVHVSFLIIVLCTYMPGSRAFTGLLDHTIAPFLGTSILFSIVAALIYIPTNSTGGFLFLHALQESVLI